MNWHSNKAQYLLCAGLLPLIPALSRPPYLTPLIFTVFVVVYLWEKTAAPSPEEINPADVKGDEAGPVAKILHFVSLYLACALITDYLNQVSLQIADTSEWRLLAYFINAGLTCYLCLGKKIALPTLFFIQALCDPLLLSGRAPLELALGTEDLLSKAGYIAAQLMQAGASAAIARTVVRL